MQQDTTKDRQMKKKKGRTWAEAAKIVLELHPKTPMSHKEILRVIKQKSLKEIGGSTPLACLNSMLHLHSRRSDPLFYKVEGRIGVYGLKCDIPEGSTMQELEEEVSCEGNLDEEEETTTNKLPKDKKKEKVLYVKLPRGYVTIPAESPSNSSACAAQNGNKSEVGGKSKEAASSPSACQSYSRTGSCRFLNSGRNNKNSNNEYCVVSSCGGGNANANAAPIPRLKVSVTRKKGCNSSAMLTSSTTSTSPAKTHSKRAIKHALKQQQKRRRKGTAISTAGTTVKYPRIVMKPLPPPPPSVPSKSSTAFELKRNSSSRNECRSRNQSVKTISFKERKCARRKVGNQLEASENANYASIDLETPKSIIVHTDLRALLNKHTFASLPHDCQQELIQLLPEVDQVCSGSGNGLRLSSSALNNEFFTRACQEWKERLADGEFVRENQAKLKAEEERDQGKLDPWKVKHFEPVWGKKSRPDATATTLEPDTSNQLEYEPKNTAGVKNDETLPEVDSEVLPPASKKLKTEHERKPQVDTTPTTTSCVTISDLEDSNVKSSKPTGKLLPQSNATVGENCAADLVSETPSCTETSNVSLPQCGNPPTCTPTLNDTLTMPAGVETVSHAPAVAQIPPVLSVSSVTVPKAAKCRSNSVNLARSHQICQEVLRSSRNREHELQSKFQLKGLATLGHLNSASATALASALAPAASNNNNVSARPPSLAVTVKLPKLLLPSPGQPQMLHCYRSQHPQQQPPQHAVQPLFVSSPNANGAVPVSLAQMFHHYHNHNHHHPVLPSLTINSVNVNLLSCRLPAVVAAPIPAPVPVVHHHHHHQTLPVITLTSNPNVAQVAQRAAQPANHHLLLRPVLVPAAATVGLSNVAVVTTGSQMAACSTSVSVANCPLSAIAPTPTNGGVGKAQEKPLLGTEWPSPQGPRATECRLESNAQADGLEVASKAGDKCPFWSPMPKRKPSSASGCLPLDNGPTSSDCCTNSDNVLHRPQRASSAPPAAAQCSSFAVVGELLRSVSMPDTSLCPTRLDTKTSERQPALETLSVPLASNNVVESDSIQRTDCEIGKGPSCDRDPSKAAAALVMGDLSDCATAYLVNSSSDLMAANRRSTPEPLNKKGFVCENSLAINAAQQSVGLQGGPAIRGDMDSLDRQLFLPMGYERVVSMGPNRTKRNNCACNLRAMIVCKQCGAFCHDDCIGSIQLCVTCLIR